jgi:hypothetical protein
VEATQRPSSRRALRWRPSGIQATPAAGEEPWRSRPPSTKSILPPHEVCTKMPLLGPSRQRRNVKGNCVNATRPFTCPINTRIRLQGKGSVGGLIYGHLIVFNLRYLASVSHRSTSRSPDRRPPNALSLGISSGEGTSRDLRSPSFAGRYPCGKPLAPPPATSSSEGQGAGAIPTTSFSLL